MKRNLQTLLAIGIYCTVAFFFIAAGVAFFIALTTVFALPPIIAFVITLALVWSIIFILVRGEHNV